MSQNLKCLRLEFPYPHVLWKENRSLSLDATPGKHWYLKAEIHLEQYVSTFMSKSIVAIQSQIFKNIKQKEIETVKSFIRIML
jgi:hypothetical protein